MTNTRLQNVTRKALFLLMMVLLGSTSLLRADEVTIGDLENAGSNSYLPMNSLYEYSFSQQIYTADEIGMPGTINSITMWLYGNENLYEMPFDIYMVEVDKDVFSSTTDWYTVTENDIVYSGSVTVHNTDAEAYTFTLDSPFEYRGNGNLLIAFNNNTGQWKSGLNGMVFGASEDPYRAVYARRDGTPYDPADLPSANATTYQRNVVVFDITSSGATRYQVSAVVNPEGAGVVTGTGKYYEDSQCTLTATPSSVAYYFENWTNEAGEVVSTDAAYTFTVTRDVTYVANFGENSIYTVTAASNPEGIGVINGAGSYFENEECSLDVFSTGEYLFQNWTVNGEVVSTSTHYTFTVTGDVDVVANFVTYDAATYYDGTITNIWTPVGMVNANVYLQSQFVMPAEDLKALAGKSIKGLKFYINSDVTYMHNGEFRVYMTQHETESIFNFIDPTTATVVYEGHFGMNNHELTITFDTPYNYYGGNLLIGINNTVLGDWYDAVFYGVDKRDAAVSSSSGSGSFSEMQTNFLPKTTFFFDEDVVPRYEVTASVNPEGAGYVYGDGLYSEGSTCILEAYANPGYTFQNWTVGGEVVSTYAAYEFTVESNVDAVANFVPSLVLTPNPVEMGYRPNNAWMNHYTAILHNNSDMYVAINDITTDNDYFLVNVFQYSVNAEFPTEVAPGEDLIVELMHGVGGGQVTGNLIVNFGDDQAVMFDMSAIAYEPGEADVWETAVEVNEYPYQGTATGLYHNYMIPEAAEDANDAVYKITVDQLSTLEVTTGNVESVFAVYPEGFKGIGGPDLNNTYSYNGVPFAFSNSFTEGFEGGLNDWWTIDVNTNGGTWLHSDENHGGYDYTEHAHSGTGFAMCYSYIDYDGPYNTDSYLVSPERYSIVAGSTLTFWADNANDSYPEYFTVCVSTAENPTADDFIEIWSGSAKGRSNSQAKVRHTENTRYDNWRFHAIDLSEFAGQNVWIAFHDVNYDMYEIWIDDVELSVNRGRDVEGFIVEAGTYYVAVAAAPNQFPVNINLGAAPAPVAAQMVYPANEAINIAAPCSFVWSLGAYTEEMQVLFGTDYPPTGVLIDWTDELVNSIGIEELEDNTMYFIQVNERNATGTTEGDVVSFLSHLTVPELMTDHEWYAYEGEEITVYWNAIDDAALLSYNVYVNDSLVVNTTELEYIIENVEYNLSTGYDVTVTAVYTYGESEQSNDLFFFVSGNGSVAGYVYEQDGVTPIAGATVLFEGEDVFGLTVSGHFTTNDEGAFEGTLPHGWYDGYANKDGYQQATCSQFIVYYNQTTEGVDFLMKEEYTPVASVTVTPGDDAATVEWSFNDRSFQFNRVYFAGAYSNEKVLLADSLFNTTSYIDSTWAELPVGSYKYGVASVYDGNAGSTRDIEEVVIGEATWTNSYVPTYNLYNYSCTNQIYTAEEIGDAGTIYSIAFMPTSVTADARNIDIYMVNTEKTAFESATDWVPVTSADLVFSGTAYWTANEWSTITLDTPFNYDGTNLCVVVNDLTGSWTSSNSYNVFDATAQALRIYQDSAPYNPAAPGNGTVLNVKNYIKIEMETSSLAGHESPIVWSEPVDKDMYTTLSITVTLNSGDSPEGAEVYISNVDQNENINFPVEPVVLDETGTYTWDSFRKGEYEIAIIKDGYYSIGAYYTTSIYEPTELEYEMIEIVSMAENLYVSPTGWAMWDEANPGLEQPNPFGPVEGTTFTEGFEEGIPADWTVIDANNDGYTWTATSSVPATWTYYASLTLDWYHSGSDAVVSGSYINGPGALTPDDYLVTPMVTLVEGSVLNFWAAATDASYPADHFGVFVSEDAENWTMVDEWTLTAKKGAANGGRESRDGSGAKLGSWYEYSVDLSAYAGEKYIAFRHFNCNDQYIMCIDDVELVVYNKGMRHYEAYNVVLTDLEGNELYSDETTEQQMQLPVDELVEGEHYIFKVAKIYSSATSEYNEVEWIYTPCENYDGATSLATTTLAEGNIVLWESSVTSGNLELNLYDTYGDGWNGGYLTLTMGDGTVETVTMESGSYESFLIQTKGNTTITYTAGGWSYENYFEVKRDGEVLLAVNSGDLYTGWEYTVEGSCQVLVMRDDEIIGFVSGTEYIDEGVTDPHDYSIRVVYSDYAMSCEQQAEFKATCTVTASAGEGGLVNGTEVYTETFLEGDVCSLMASTYDDYVFNNWTKDGQEVSTDSWYTFTVTGNETYFANFVDMSNFYIVDPNAYESNMTLTGIVKIDGVEQDNRFLEVSAWSGDEVRGAAFLEHVDITIGENTIDRYFVFMTVYGNEGDELTFKLYDHNTAEELDIMCTSNLTFEADENYGSLTEPYEINFMNVIAVDYQFTPGWNWWSTHVELSSINGLEMLEDGLGASSAQIASQSAFTKYYESFGWYGSLTSINNESMYRIKVNEGETPEVTMTGAEANPEDHPITIKNGWNHIGFISGVQMSVTDALAGLTPQPGDMIKTQKAYAKYYDTYGWYGSLSTIVPGDGLMYKSSNVENIQFTYPATSRSEYAENLTGDNNHWVPNVYAYPYNMTVMAVVEMEGVELASDDYEVAAFANGECRGSVRLIYSEVLNRYVAFLTISGEEATSMRFGLYNTVTGEEFFDTDAALTYSTDEMVGDPDAPFVISFRGTNLNGLANDVMLYPNPAASGEKVSVLMSTVSEAPVRIEIVDALGKLVSVETATNWPASITVPSSNGVYTVRIITENNGVMIQKLIVR